MDTVPAPVWVLAAVALLGIAVTLADLARRDVRHMPKWLWALVVVLVSFPMGAVLYFVVGRVPPGESAQVPAARTAPSGFRAPEPVAPPGRATAPPLRARDRPAPEPPEAGPPVVTTRAWASATGPRSPSVTSTCSPPVG